MSIVRIFKKKKIFVANNFSFFFSSFEYIAPIYVLHVTLLYSMLLYSC